MKQKGGVWGYHATAAVLSFISFSSDFHYIFVIYFEQSVTTAVLVKTWSFFIFQLLKYPCQMNMVTFVIGLIFVPCLSSPVTHPVPRPVPHPVISPVPHHQPCMVTAGLVCHDLNQYRSQNGECNNLKNPRWGAAMTAFKRLLPNSYQNKISLPRYLKVITFQNYIFRLTNKYVYREPNTMNRSDKLGT